MASDTQDSKRKHRRSSDDDAVDSSKRRKHRHHHHHRRHRHGSRKHEAEGEGKHEAEGKRETEDFVAPPTPQPAATVVAVLSGSNWRPDYDMEEGEILEEEGFGVGSDAIEKKKTDSDAESGEIKGPKVRNVSDVQTPVGYTSPCFSRLAFCLVFEEIEGI